MEIDLVPDPGALPVRHDSIRAVDVAAHEVLKKIVAVETATALPQLGNPRPDLLGRGANSDRAGCDEIRAWDEVISREGLVRFLVGRAPPQR
jgi:hypothetical protein